MLTRCVDGGDGVEQLISCFSKAPHMTFSKVCPREPSGERPSEPAGAGTAGSGGCSGRSPLSCRSGLVKLLGLLHFLFRGSLSTFELPTRWPGAMPGQGEPTHLCTCVCPDSSLIACPDMAPF